MKLALDGRPGSQDQKSFPMGIVLLLAQLQFVEGLGGIVEPGHEPLDVLEAMIDHLDSPLRLLLVQAFFSAAIPATAAAIPY